MIITDNPTHDFFQHEAEIEEAAAQRPRCQWCEEPIFDDGYYYVDGVVICPDCIKDCWKWID